MQSSFDSALAFVLAREGGKSDDPLDRGGRTNMGVTQRLYDDWRANKGQSKRDVWLMDKDEATQLYIDQFWSKVRGDDLPAPIDMIMFDSAVQHSPEEAAVFVHAAMGVQEADNIGPLTVQQVARYCQEHGAKDLAAEIIVERVNFYRHLIAADPSQKRFENGWGNRVSLLCDAAGLQEEKV